MKSIREWFKCPGVRDLPLDARLHLAKALHCEERGNHAMAHVELTRAVQPQPKGK